MLYSCAVYISSGVASVASRVAAAAKAATPCVAVVDTFTDAAYARSSVKLVAEAEPLLSAAEAAAAEALALVDLSKGEAEETQIRTAPMSPASHSDPNACSRAGGPEPHPAPHPRQGAVDMVSFMPLSELSADVIGPDLERCDALAWRLGERLGESHRCPVLLYGPRAGRSLLQTRRGTSFFRSTKASNPREATTVLRPDFGPGAVEGPGDAPGESAPALELPQSCGVAIVGVQPYVTNFNICVANAPLEACREVATALRSAMGVQVMALPHAEGTAEIGCNLQATDTRDSPCCDEVLEFVTSRLPAGHTVPRAYVIGLTPGAARKTAEDILEQQAGGAPMPPPLDV